MTDRELLELIAAQVGVLTTNVDTLTNNMDSLTKDVSKLTEGQSNIESEIKEFRAETNTRFDKLEDKINDLEGTNAYNHIGIRNKLNKVSDDVEFLSHKEFQTEREMYHIKQKLMDRKRKIK